MLPPRDTYMLQQILFDFHLRSIEDRAYDKARRFSLLIHEIAQNFRFRLDPRKYPENPCSDSKTNQSK